MCLTVILESCTVQTGNAVNIIGEHWSQELTEALVYAVDSSMLWDQFGIIGDVTVSNLLISCHQVVNDPHHPTLTFSPLEHASLFHTHSRTFIPQPPTQSFKPFTSNFPQADIYKVITPNILHQVIKGTFKDHLVTWVEEYLILVHSKMQAAVVLDDINCRYVCNCMICHLLTQLFLLSALHWHQHSWDFDAFHKVMASNNGQATI
jgi:hypothetical protein